MKLFLFLFAVIIVVVNGLKTGKKCEGISVAGKMYREEIMLNGIDRPYQLCYHKLNDTQHILYFSYNVGHTSESTFEIGYAYKGSFVPTPVKKVQNGFATAVNHKYQIIYFGGSDGIHVQNLLDPVNILMLVPNYNIWDIFLKDAVYFITFPKRRLYRHIHNITELQHHIPERLYQFAIDGDKDTFITNKTGLYMIKNGTNHRIHLKGPKVFRAIEVNNKGVAHFCGQNEIFVVDKKKEMLREIVKVKNIFGLTFDEDDNIIYSDPHQIVRLLPKPCKV